MIETLKSQQIYSFSIGIALQLGSANDDKDDEDDDDEVNRDDGSDPSIARIIPRNVLSGSYSDFSAYDMFLRSVVSKDPFEVAASLRRRLNKFHRNLKLTSRSPKFTSAYKRRNP